MTVPPLKLRSQVAKAAPIQAGRFPSPALAVRHGHSTGSTQLCHQHSTHAAGAARPPSPRLLGLQLLLGCPEPPGTAPILPGGGCRGGLSFSPLQRFHPIGMPRYRGLLPILCALPPHQRAPARWDRPHGVPLAGGPVGCPAVVVPCFPRGRGVTPQGAPHPRGYRRDVPHPPPGGKGRHSSAVPLLLSRLHRIASPGCPHLSQAPPPASLPASALGISAAPTSPAAPVPQGTHTAEKRADPQAGPHNAASAPPGAGLRLGEGRRLRGGGG